MVDDLGLDIKVKRTNKSDAERRLREEARRKVSMANKRLKRLEEQDLTKTPAYRQWVEDGSQKFSVRGKSKEELRQEIARMDNFLKKQTSTVRGAKQYLNNVAKQIGITDFSNYAQLQNTINNFFEVTSKVKEYLQNSKEIGVAIGYQKIWEEVSNYIQEVGREIKLTEEDVLDIANNLVRVAGYGEIDKMLDEWVNKF